VDIVILEALILTFVLSVAAWSYLTLRPRRAAIERLQSLPVSDAGPQAEASDAAGAPAAVDQRTMRMIRKRSLKTPISMGNASETQRLLHHAGRRSGTALYTFNMIWLITMAALPVLFWLASRHVVMSPAARLLGIGGFLLVGYIAPRFVLKRLARRRQHRLRLSLPDALDLLVISVEAGMGLNQAIVKVAEELERTHPEMSDEFKLVNLEIRAGRTRTEAIRNLGERTGVDDIVSLAAMLIQTDKFGTSVARSLRVHSDALRTERVQRAEEAAAKTTIKLIFPLLFCVFPALLVVILGPAFLNLARIFGEVVVNTQ